MIAGRMLSTLIRTRVMSYAKPQSLKQRQNLTMFLLVCKLSSYQVTKNIEHISQNNRVRTDKATWNFNREENKPLLVLLSWLLPKRAHVMKYVNLYLQQEFDVLLVSITPWQLLWPTKGSRMVAADLIEFLTKQQSYQQILLHGFSVAGYMWGEVLDLLQHDPQKCNDIFNRIVGQVWDSLADVNDLAVGTPRALFPKNEMLQNIGQKYFEYHLKTFYKQSTQYYIRSSQLFHTNTLRKPALMFVSKADTVSSLMSNLRVKESWDSLGTKTYMKIFEKSRHVEHYRKYPKEYTAELYAFLNKLNLMQKKKKVEIQI